MNAETKKALQGSINKWKKIATGKAENGGVYDCPLCILFFDWDGKSPLCSGCPVSAKTGKGRCKGTPYEKFEAAEDSKPFPYTDRMIALAKEELKFLQSLLPKKD